MLNKIKFHRGRKIIIQTLFFFLLLTQINFAQWVQTNGPYGGGTVTAFAVNGTNLFAGTDGNGIFRSINNGTSWTPVNSGITNPFGKYVSSFAVCGTNLFVGTSGGLFLSTNNGTIWSAISTPFSSAHCMASLDTNLFVGSYGIGVFLSTDNGASWAPVNSGLTNNDIQSLAVCPNGAGGTNLFAGTYRGGVFLSTDNGTSWAPVNSGLTDMKVHSLHVSSTNIFAGTENGVFISTDNGTNWSPSGLTNMLVLSFANIEMNLFAGTFSGVFHSTDQGTSWTQVNSGLTNIYAYSLAVIDANLFAGTKNGVFLSDNNGASWIPVDKGLMSVEVGSFASIGTNLFAAGSFGGVFLSTDNGTNWTPVNSGLTNKIAYSLAVNPNGASGTNLFTGTDGGVFLSTDNGTSWTPVNSGLTDTVIRSLSSIGTNLFAGTYFGTFLSTDNGNNWTPIKSGLTNKEVHSFEGFGTNLFAGTDDGIFLSTDNGTSWTRINSSPVYVESFAVIKANLFAGTGYGVYRSTDNGISWISLSSSPGPVNSFAVFKTNLFAETSHGIFLSTNNGASWYPVNLGLTDFRVNSIYISGKYLFAGINYNGVWKRPLTDMFKSSVIVNTTKDAGSGSLRQAVEYTNNHPGLDTILFNIPDTVLGFDSKTGFWTIEPNTPLPAITDSVLIDGYSQKDFNGNDTNPFGPEIFINGINAGQYANGLVINSPCVHIQGLTVGNFNSTGIIINKSDGCGIYGCYVGVTPTGDQAAPNGYGIELDSCSSIEILPAGADKNVISGNTNAGILVQDSSSNITVADNIIGLDRTMLYGIGNGNYGGIVVEYGCSNVNISNNWIDKNKYGIFILGSNNIDVHDNLIGTVIKGEQTLNLGNDLTGIYLCEKAHDNLILENNIRFNKVGVYVTDTNTVRNKISHNSITDNVTSGIILDKGGDNSILPPVITSANTASVTGTSLPNTTVEVYTDSTNQGEWYLGETKTDSLGDFQLAISDSVKMLKKVTAIAIDEKGNTSEFSQSLIITGVNEELNNIPKEFKLSQNYPNPFNPTTNFEFAIAKGGLVTLRIYDILGEEIATIVNKELHAGNYKYQWNAGNLASGVYFYRLKAGNFIDTKKLILMK